MFNPNDRSFFLALILGLSRLIHWLHEVSSRALRLPAVRCFRELSTDRIYIFLMNFDWFDLLQCQQDYVL